jgi:enterochelin esterase-like enzyme
MPRNDSTSRFRTVELSNPAFEDGGVRELTLRSPALRGRGDASLFLPPGCETESRVPLVVLLHGVYSSHWAWFRKGAAHRTALQLMRSGRMRQMILVCPSDGLSGDGTGYLPGGGAGADYERWIVDDLTECVRELFPCAADSATFLTGLSMGGYGALRLGAKYPRRFQGISAHSAITRVEQLNDFVFEPFPTEGLPPEELDVLHWLRINRNELPPLRFDCGRADALFEANRRLHEALDADGIAHQFHAHEGGHNWEYWQERVADSLLFFDSI